MVQPDSTFRFIDNDHELNNRFGYGTQMLTAADGSCMPSSIFLPHSLEAWRVGLPPPARLHGNPGRHSRCRLPAWQPGIAAAGACTPLGQRRLVAQGADSLPLVPHSIQCLSLRPCPWHVWSRPCTAASRARSIVRSKLARGLEPGAM